ncbi:MAG TPA: hypothetical protein VL997_07450 [Dyella sp.]|nr:hypothetical protein [Dyella sp.]
MAKNIVYRLLLCGVMCFGWGRAAQADTSCEASFKTQGSVQAGLKFLADQHIPGLKPMQAIQLLSDNLKGQGLEIYSTFPNNQTATLDAGPSRVLGNPKYISHYIADQSGQHVLVISYVQPGLAADPADAKKKLCAVLESVASSLRSDSDFSRTAPPGDQANGVASPSGSAGGRTDASSEAQGMNVLKPSEVFDEASAKAALQPGHSTITGTACVRHTSHGEGGALALASNQKILLFPDSPYLEDFVKLVHGAKQGRDKVDADPRFMAATMTATTNSKGQFQFAQMKPGKYYLFTTMSGNIDNAELNVSKEYADGGQTIVQTTSIDHYTTSFGDILDKFVTVGDGQTINITLTGHPNLMKMLIHPNDNGGYAGVFGCRQNNALY